MFISVSFSVKTAHRQQSHEYRASLFGHLACAVLYPNNTTCCSEANEQDNCEGYYLQTDEKSSFEFHDSVSPIWKSRRSYFTCIKLWSEPVQWAGNIFKGKPPFLVATDR
jgi:hypothetical protein